MSQIINKKTSFHWDFITTYSGCVWLKSQHIETQTVEQIAQVWRPNNLLYRE